MKPFSRKTIASCIFSLIAIAPVVTMAEEAPPANPAPSVTLPSTAPKTGGEEHKEHKKKHKKHHEDAKDEKAEKAEKSDATGTK